MNKRKVLMAIFALLIILTLVSCGNNNLEKVELSQENMEKHLNELINFNGRKIGTEGNHQTVEYIERYFKKIGLEPIKEDYKSGFDVITYDWEGKPLFNVIDKEGNIIKSYNTGIDYKIRLDNIGIGGKFKGPLEHINKKEQIIKNEIKFTDQAVLVDYMDSEIIDSGFQGDSLDDRIFYSGAKVLIYPEAKDVSKMDIELGNKNKWLVESGLIKLGVREEVYEELLAYYENGYELDIDIPIVFEKSRADNVAGIIKSNNKSYDKTIVIAAPIDGIGEDHDGKPYSNASDTGISTSLLLELGRYTVENKIKTNADIVFLGVNATETGYLGFDRYNREKLFKYDKSEIIYLDDLGINEENDLIIGSYIFEDMNYQNNKLTLNKMINTGKNHNIKLIEDQLYTNSKYMEFRQRGIISTILTYGESPVAGTLEDNIDNINFENIEDVGKLILNYIDDYGKPNIGMELISVIKSIYIYLLIGIFLILFKLFYINKNEEKRLAIFLKDKHIITIYLIGLFFLFTIVLQTQNHIRITRGIILEDIVLDSKGFTDIIFSHILHMGMMILLLIPSIGLILGLITLLIGLKNKGTINDFKTLALTIGGSYIFVFLNLNRFYNHGFSSIFPEILSLKYSLHLSLAIIALFTSLIIYILGKEKPEIKNLKKITIFIITFVVFAIIFYSPYVASKSLIELKNFNGTLRF